MHCLHFVLSATPVHEETRRQVGLRPTSAQLIGDDLYRSNSAKPGSCKTFAVKVSLEHAGNPSQHARAFTASERFTTEPSETRLEKCSGERVPEREQLVNNRETTVRKRSGLLENARVSNTHFDTTSPGIASFANRLLLQQDRRELLVPVSVYSYSSRNTTRHNVCS